MPMCIFTFIDKFDMTGKTMIPFCTNEGSGMGSSESDLKKLSAVLSLKRDFLYMVLKQNAVKRR